PDKGKTKGDESPGAMAHKVMHDAAAYIRSLAQMRGRNADWGERAMNEAASLSAEEALKEKVVDLLAADVPQLLERVDGKVLEVNGRKITLATRGAAVVAYEADWRARFLGI